MDAGVTPNAVTVSALVLSALGGGAVLWRPDEAWPLLALPAVLTARMALNALDGMMAREHGLASPLGALLNELGDVLADAALYLPLARVAPFPAPLVVAVATLGIVGEMAGLAAVTVGAERRYDGPLGKSDRAFLFGALALAVGLGAEGGTWMGVVLALAAALAALTVANRLRAAQAGAGR